MSQSNYGGALRHENDTAYFGFVTTRVSVTTGVTEIVSADGSRQNLCLTNLSTDTDVFVSASSTLTAGDGYPLMPRTHYIWPHAGVLYGIAASAINVAVAEQKL